MSSDATENAAVLVMLLEERQASAILAQLEPDELRRIGQKMCELGEIGPQAIVEAISGFVDRIEGLGLSAHGRMAQIRTMMVQAVGEVKADSLLEQVAPDSGHGKSSLELARWLSPEALIPLVAGEHPQAIAVLLVQLDPEIAAKVLHGMPEKAQGDIVHRIATLGPVAPAAIEMLEALLTARISERHGKGTLSMGGPREAADIINNAAKAVEKRVMPEIGKRDKLLARQIEAEMFKFEHLYALDGQAMGSLLREVESSILIDALKGIAEEERDPFFRAMSSRAADGVRDEIEARGRLRREDVVIAQKAIIDIARRLADEGVLQLGSAAEDEYV